MCIGLFFVCTQCVECVEGDSCLWHSAAPSEDEPPVAKAPVQRKTKEAAPKKAPAAKKTAAPRKKAAGIHALKPSNTRNAPASKPWFKFGTWKCLAKIVGFISHQL